MHGVRRALWAAWQGDAMRGDAMRCAQRPPSGTRGGKVRRAIDVHGGERELVEARPPSAVHGAEKVRARQRANTARRLWGWGGAGSTIGLRVPGRRAQRARSSSGGTLNSRRIRPNSARNCVDLVGPMNGCRTERTREYSRSAPMANAQKPLQWSAPKFPCGDVRACTSWRP
jgi:hypothetical protein